jgi:hypothetical protein
MIALNIVLMTAVLVGIVSLLTWAIVSDRHSKRAAGGELPVAVAPLAQNLEMPDELRRAHRSSRSHAPRTRRPATRSASSTAA